MHCDRAVNDGNSQIQLSGLICPQSANYNGPLVIWLLGLRDLARQLLWYDTL